MDEIVKRLEAIERLLQDQQLTQKNVLSFAEACLYLEVSESHLYKLTSSNGISHYKPNGKKIYFKREELDQWLLRNRANTQEELAAQTNQFLIKTERRARS